jgi:hypothetical protein
MLGWIESMVFRSVAGSVSAVKPWPTTLFVRKGGSSAAESWHLPMLGMEYDARLRPAPGSDDSIPQMERIGQPLEVTLLGCRQNSGPRPDSTHGHSGIVTQWHSKLVGGNEAPPASRWGTRDLLCGVAVMRFADIGEVPSGEHPGDRVRGGGQCTRDSERVATEPVAGGETPPHLEES